jgi:putative pyruvate formate lyase activating enzyme
MHRQQPKLILDKDEIASQGMILRHLVLPGRSEDSIKALKWTAVNLSPTIGLSLMSQYYPCFQAPPEIQRTLSQEEYHQVLDFAQTLGIENLFIQPEPFSRDENLMPDFTEKEPFKWK